MRPSALAQIERLAEEEGSDAKPSLEQASEAVRELLGRARRGNGQLDVRDSQMLLRESVGVGIDHNLDWREQQRREFGGAVRGNESGSVKPSSNASVLGAASGLLVGGGGVPVDDLLTQQQQQQMSQQAASTTSMLDEGSAADSAIWVGHSSSGPSSSFEQQQHQSLLPGHIDGPLSPCRQAFEYYFLQQKPKGGAGSSTAESEARSRMAALKANISQLSNRITSRMHQTVAADSLPMSMESWSSMPLSYSASLSGASTGSSSSPRRYRNPVTVVENNRSRLGSGKTSKRRFVSAPSVVGAGGDSVLAAGASSASTAHGVLGGGEENAPPAPLSVTTTRIKAWA